MDELFPEERETVAAPSDPSRGPPVRPRRASVQGTEGTEEAGARVPADSGPSEPRAIARRRAHEDEDKQIQEGVFGKRVPKTLGEPYVPTQAEIDEHNKTHLPWRSWCAACVGGGAVAHPHFPAPDDPESTRLPHCLIDYFFMGQEEGKVLPMIGMKERQNKMKFAHQVEEKGPNEYAIEAIVEDIES